MISLARFLAWFYLIISTIIAVFILVSDSAVAESYLMVIGIFMQGLVIFCVLSLVAQIAENTAPALTQLSDAGVEAASEPKVVTNDYELHDAAWSGNYLGVKNLILYGADVNLRNSDGKTPLDLAKERRDDLIVKLLQAHGAA
ncbi:ankyrin repeat domain-containing protein [Shewanella sp. 1180_01]|uniref:ankyrin repeat domain-containing protein n=1 Tax=Shewanella sp. 1180_01 TaxID=2604451 RepID=UPI0040628BEB